MVYSSAPAFSSSAMTRAIVRLLLADRDVDAVNRAELRSPSAADLVDAGLVDDRVHADRGLAGLSGHR
jgi:hypothetical protein